MTEYFEQQGADVRRPRVPVRALYRDDEQAAVSGPIYNWQNDGWEIQPPQPPALRVRQRHAGVLNADASDQNDVPPLLRWPFVGFEVQPPQPPTQRYRQRIAGILPGDAADQGDQPALLVPFRQGWENQAWQPPPLLRRLVSAALARGDEGIQFIFVPAWAMAPRATTFPDIQNIAAAATPAWDAGPQIGAVSSQPNLTQPTVLKAGPGTLFAVNVIVAGTAAGGVYDVASNTPSVINQIAVIPNTVGQVLLNWPCQQGILLVPGAGMTVSAKWV